jgi:hypothetical protein
MPAAAIRYAPCDRHEDSRGLNQLKGNYMTRTKLLIVALVGSVLLEKGMSR